MKERGRIVYTSGPGGGSAPAPRDAAPAGPAASLDPARQQPRVRRERGGRGGKTVTTAGPLVLVEADATALLHRFKKLCGCGGSLKATPLPGGEPAFTLEIQGDHADRVVAELVALGYKAKRAGG